MIPVNFEGAVEIKKPGDMTDEQCTSIWAAHGVNEGGYPFFETAWKPSYEDLQALNNGGTIRVITMSNGLPPMALFVQETNQLEGGGNQS